MGFSRRSAASLNLKYRVRIAPLLVLFVIILHQTRLLNIHFAIINSLDTSTQRSESIKFLNKLLQTYNKEIAHKLSEYES
ncbi:hypothetical protein EV421DRAFT_1825440 [Armillaria borealis]|uniref:Uncharacterized protein n=1 Tax=Armillaria borealis TaxID=47425 RepID=A0AA39ML29_9AGAR|nr:hypothetical protein EV421DRAFT_1825440 [Armillaria borealis]